ncbi:glycerol dehydrogenase [Acetobacteraceae bacterium]|nr:glycerol dehydrogenase [Acetobacteraceae bacterium]
MAEQQTVYSSSVPYLLASPSKFCIGAGLLSRLENTVKDFGDNLFIISDAFILPKIEKESLPHLKKSKLQVHVEEFQCECSEAEIKRNCSLAKEKKANVIVGIGGGKTLDTAKAVAFYTKNPVILYPTIASTDAPCTALAVVYGEDGSFSHYLYIPQNPNAVLVDTNIVAAAPARFFSAGVGDALSTWFEARAVWRSHGLNLLHHHCTRTALGIAKLCFEILSENIELAMESAECHVPTPAFQQVVEATIYLSGIGAESAGLAAAHAVHNGMCIVPELHHCQHGEKVIFGLLVQLVLENAPKEEIEEVARIAKYAHLPLTLEALGVKKFDPEIWREVAKISCDDADTMKNMPTKPNAEEVYAAILAADKLGRRLSV